MKLELDTAEVAPLVEQITRQVVAELSPLLQAGRDRIAWSEPEAAALLGWPDHRLKDARLRGAITYTRIGRGAYYQMRDLQRFLAAGREGQTK